MTQQSHQSPGCAGQYTGHGRTVRRAVHGKTVQRRAGAAGGSVRTAAALNTKAAWKQAARRRATVSKDTQVCVGRG